MQIVDLYFGFHPLDLKAELAVSSKVNPATKSAVEEANEEFKENNALERNTDAVDNATNTTPLQIREVRDRLNGRLHNQSGSTPNNTFTPNPALTPSARISALNIVGDLLRKVGVRRCSFMPGLKFSFLFQYVQ